MSTIPSAGLVALSACNPDDNFLKSGAYLGIGGFCAAVSYFFHENRKLGKFLRLYENKKQGLEEQIDIEKIRKSDNRAFGMLMSLFSGGMMAAGVSLDSLPIMLTSFYLLIDGAGDILSGGHHHLPLKAVTMIHDYFKGRKSSDIKR